MGVIYYAVNEAREAYELGKGAWHSITDDKGIIQSEGIEAKVSLACSELFKHLDGYDRHVSDGLKAFGLPAKLMSDSSDETWDLKVKAHRYAKLVDGAWRSVPLEDDDEDAA